MATSGSNEKEKVGVMMPVYNGAKFIATALDSVLSQTYDNVFPIIYDDGSTDDTLKILSKYNDSRITILEGKVNKGLPAADNALRSYIISNTGYPYIAWLAADDRWRKDKIENQLDFMKRNDIDISYTDTVFLSGDGKANTIKSMEFDNNALVQINFINGSSIMMRRVVLEILSWNEEYKNVEDWDFYLRCYKEGFKFKRLEGAYVMNLKHSENLSRNREKEAYYHAKVCLAHKLPIEIAAMRMMRIGDPSMIRGIMKAWTEAGEP